MLNLEDAIKNAVERICRDRNEDDKIYIHVSDLAGEAIRQHAKILHDMRRANEEAQELTKAKADGRLAVLPCKAGDTIWKIKAVFSYFSKPMEDRVERIIITNSEILVYCTSGTKFSVNSIGKTVFLSREEAEKALQEGLR
jgi:hypothetical protein